MKRNAPPSVPHAALRAPVSRRAWSEVLYCVLGLPLSIAGFVLTVSLLAPGLLLTAPITLASGIQLSR